MLGRVGGRLEGSSEGRVLGHRAALDCVAMVVHEVAQLGIVEDLPRPCVLLRDVRRVLQPPKMEQDRLEELIIDGGETEMLDVLFKLTFGDCVLPSGSVEILDGQ